MKEFRTEDICISPESLFYLKMERKLLENKIGGNALTFDEIADNIIRNRLTTDHPEWVEVWAELQDARQESIKIYREIEAKAL